ncbi:MAG: hypothetical protein P4L83_16060, partial [Nevskia sp.]|nr:hypothetical protein [Nevskia sp.]
MCALSLGAPPTAGADPAAAEPAVPPVVYIKAADTKPVQAPALHLSEDIVGAPAKPAAAPAAAPAAPAPVPASAAAPAEP